VEDLHLKINVKAPKLASQKYL